MPETQNAQKHARFYPPFHFVASPLLLANLGVAIFFTVHDWPSNRFLHCWWIVMSLGFFVMLLVSRTQPLRAQDRVIRLEERLRHAALMSPEQLRLVSGLSVRQIIALRFASDEELPALALRAATENLTPKAIKTAILVWRPDHLRV